MGLRTPENPVLKKTVRKRRAGAKTAAPIIPAAALQNSAPASWLDPRTGRLPSALTFKNHFQFGYDGIPFARRTSPNQKWWVSYGRCSRRAMDWRSECIVAARQIRASTTQDIWICFSGGINSEIVAESFRQARIPFRVAIQRFDKDLNLHDICWAVAYCEAHDIPYEFFETNIEEFFEGGEMMQFADLSQCVTPQLPALMKLMEMIGTKGGYPVLGGGECYLSKQPAGWQMFEPEKVAALYRYLWATKTPGQPGFFHWSPEIILSMLIDPMVVGLLKGEFQGHTSSLHLRENVYKRYWKLAVRKKCTGYEKIMHLDKKWRVALEQKYPDFNQAVYVGYSDLLRKLVPRDVPNTEGTPAH